MIRCNKKNISLLHMLQFILPGSLFTSSVSLETDISYTHWYSHLWSLNINVLLLPAPVYPTYCTICCFAYSL